MKEKAHAFWKRINYNIETYPFHFVYRYSVTDPSAGGKRGYRSTVSDARPSRREGEEGREKFFGLCLFR